MIGNGRKTLGELPEIVVENLPGFVTAAAPEVSKAGNRPFDFPRHNSTSVDLGKRPVGFGENALAGHSTGKYVRRR